MPDPYRGFNYLVELNNLTTAGFQECSGLDTSTDSQDYREGTDPNHMRKLTGLNKFSPITLKRGITDDDALWKWRQRVMDGRPDRQDISIVLLNEAREEKWRWNLRRAWPTKWTGPTFNAMSNDIAIETLEIMAEEVVKA